LEFDLIRSLVAAGFRVEDVTPDQINVSTYGNGPSSVLGLSNFRRIWSQTTEVDRQSKIDTFVSQAQEALKSTDDRVVSDRFVPRLLPGGRDRSMSAPWSEPIAEDALRLAIAVVYGSVVRFIQPMDFVQWSLSVKEVKRRARDNLIEQSRCIQPHQRQDGSVWFCSGDTLDAARLLIVHRWFENVAGLLTMVPTRDCLWVVPISGPDSLPLAASLWAESRLMIQTSPYPVSSQVFLSAEGALSVIPVRQRDGHLQLQQTKALQCLMKSIENR